MDNFASILDHHADRRPGKIVISHGERSVTNQEFHRRVNAVAAALADLGVGRGDRVAVLLYNRIEFLEVVFAVNRLGAAFLPLNFRLAPAEWEYIIGHAEASVIVTEGEFARAIGELSGRLPVSAHQLLVGPSPEGEPPAGVWVDYDEIAAAHDGALVPVADVGPEDLQRVMYTSGTTSRPKGVCISHRNVMYKNLGLLVQFGWTADEITAVAGPLYHVGALDMGGLTTLHAGGSLVLQTKFEARSLVALIERHRATNVWLAPAMVNALLQADNLRSSDLSSLKVILSGGEKMPEARLKEILALFPGLWFADAYGLTETVSSDTFITPEHMHSKLGSVGKPLPHQQVRIVDDGGAPLPAGHLGEIALRGPKVFTRYWRDEEATARAIRDGWFHTGDIGRLDDDGFLYIEDRKKDMIVSGGENIASPEVERVLYEHPDVLEAAVVGTPHPRWGEVPHAFVVLREGAEPDAEGLIAFCRTRLAKFKVPTGVGFVTELPRTPSGKVLKRVLRDAR